MESGETYKGHHIFCLSIIRALNIDYPVEWNGKFGYYTGTGESYPPTQRVFVNKRTHRVRFEHETEDSVEVVIEAQ